MTALSWIVVLPDVGVFQRLVRVNLILPDNLRDHERSWFEHLSDEWLIEEAVNQYRQDRTAEHWRKK